MRGEEIEPSDVAAKSAVFPTGSQTVWLIACGYFVQLVRLERRAGNDIIATTYALRLMRWLGRDQYGDLPFVAATLEGQGFTHEADAARAMFGGEPDAFDQCLDLIGDAVERNGNGRKGRSRSSTTGAGNSQRGITARVGDCLALQRRGQVADVVVDA